MKPTRRNLIAVAALAVVLSACRRSPEENYRRGLAEYQKGAYAKAAGHFEQALAGATATPEALTFLGACELQTGKTDKALSHFQQALKLDANYAPARYNLALSQLERGHVEAAANDLRLVAQVPGAKAQLALAYNNLAVAAARQRDYPRAEKYLRDALAADPASAVVMQNLAALKAKTSPVAATVKPVTTVVSNVAPIAVVKATPPVPAPVAVKTTSVAPVATPSVKRRVALAPRALPAGNRQEATKLFNEALGLHQKGKVSEAVPVYEKAVAADASFAPAYYNLAIGWRSLRQVEKALENYELALMADGRYGDARLNYALLLQEQGYVADAVDQFEGILRESPGNATVHLAAASLYSRDRGTLGKARQHYEAYLRLAPDGPRAAEIRRWLEQNR